MISSPLFIIVAESIVILGPSSRSGAPERPRTVIARRSPRSRSRNGPPDAVRTSRAPPRGRRAQRLVNRAVLGVHRHDLRSRLPASRRISSPAMTRASLFASASRLPAERRPTPSAARARRRAPLPPCRPPGWRRLPRGPQLPRRPGCRRPPAGAVASRDSSSAARPRRRLSRRCSAACSASFSIGRPAARATTRNRSGNAAATCSAEQPIDPVEPSTARPCMAKRKCHLAAIGDREGPRSASEGVCGVRRASSVPLRERGRARGVRGRTRGGVGPRGRGPRNRSPERPRRSAEDGGGRGEGSGAVRSPERDPPSGRGWERRRRRR